MLCKYILSWNPFLSNLSSVQLGEREKSKWFQLLSDMVVKWDITCPHHSATASPNSLVQVVVLNWELWVIKQVGVSIQANQRLDFSSPESQKCNRLPPTSHTCHPSMPFSQHYTLLCGSKKQPWNFIVLGLLAMPWETSATPANARINSPLSQHQHLFALHLPVFPVPHPKLSPFAPTHQSWSRSRRAPFAVFLFRSSLSGEYPFVKLHCPYTGVLSSEWLQKDTIALQKAQECSP